MHPVHHVFLSTITKELYQVRQQSRTLTHVHAADSGTEVFRIDGFLARVRVISTTRGPKKLLVQFFYGKVHDLSFDPS